MSHSEVQSCLLVASVLRAVEIETAVCITTGTGLTHEGRRVVEGVASVDIRGVAPKR